LCGRVLGDSNGSVSILRPWCFGSSPRRERDVFGPDATWDDDGAVIVDQTDG